MGLVGFLLVVGSVMLPLLAIANERLVIDFNNASYSGRNTFDLRRSIKGDFRYADWLTLDSIEVEVMPRDDRAWVALEVGGSRTDKHRLETDLRGRRDDHGWHEVHPRPQVVRINNPSYSSNGAWLLHMHGDLVLNRVVLYVNRPERAERREQYRDRDDRFEPRHDNDEMFPVQTCIGGSKCGGRHAEARVNLGRPRYVSRILIKANDDVGSRANASINVYADGNLVASSVDIKKDGKVRKIDVNDRIHSIVIKPATDDEAVIEWVKIER